MSRLFVSLGFMLLSLLLQGQAVYEDARLYLNSTDGVYQMGDTVKVTARLESGKDKVLVEVFRYGKLVSKDEALLKRGDTRIYSEVFSDPVSIMVKVSPVDEPRTSTSVGFLVSPEKFSPGFRVPSDLRAFWDGELARMRALPPEVKISPAENITEEGADRFECYKFEINMPDGAPCRGYVAYPRGAEPGSLPIHVFLHAAGVNKPHTYDKANRVISMARKGCIALDVNAHGFLSDQPQEYYDALFHGELDNYAQRDFSGISDYYFHNMYLRDVRALDYAVTIPLWDGRRILVQGESQGGGQALAVAGIDERVSHAVATVPALTDMGACLAGRKSGWPSRANSKNAGTGLGTTVLAYHDGATLISLFRGDLYVEAGNIDLTCDPAAVSAGFNTAKAVRSKEIHYFPWRPHTKIEERAQEEWKQTVLSRREAFIDGFLGAK